MSEIICGSLVDSNFARNYAPHMFRMRFRVFHERLHWQVRCQSGCEVDEFDDAQTLYILARTEDSDEPCGSWRLRPTTTPYMLSDIFPDLLHGQPAPRSPTIWEISRFAVDRHATACNGFGFNDIANNLVRATIQHAVDNGITQYVMVVSVAVERLLRHTGMVLHRFGPPMMLGKVRSVACWLDIDAHTRHVILGHPEPLPLLVAA